MFSMFHCKAYWVYLCILCAIQIKIYWLVFWYQLYCHVTAVELLLQSFGQSWCRLFVNLSLRIYFIHSASWSFAPSSMTQFSDLTPSGSFFFILWMTTTNFDQNISLASAAQDNKHAVQCLLDFSHEEPDSSPSCILLSQDNISPIVYSLFWYGVHCWGKKWFPTLGLCLCSGNYCTHRHLHHDMTIKSVSGFRQVICWYSSYPWLMAAFKNVRHQCV